LTYCKGLSVSDVVPNSSQTATELSVLQNKSQAINGLLGDIEQEINNLTDSITHTPSEEVRRVLKKSLQVSLSRQSNLEKGKRDVHIQIDRLLSNGKNTEEQLKSIRELIDKMKELKGQKRVDLRVNLRNQLRRLISKIRIDAMNIVIFFKSGQHRLIKLYEEDASRKKWDSYPPKDMKLAQEGKLSDDVGPLPEWMFKGVKPK